jgi:uncharacterized protein (DUF1697 family)
MATTKVDLRHVAFLRGINLGKRRVTNETLRRCVAELGFDDVATFRGSGNVVLSAADGTPAALARRLEEGLEAALGYGVAVFLRSAGEVRAIAAHEPFPAAAVAASDGKLQVALLTRKPTAAQRAKVLAHATDADRLALHGRELYWLPSGRMADSTLDLDAIWKLLGTTTMRTKGTIELLAAKYCPQA